MKLITFTVPCYNSQAYMERCIDTLLTAGEDAEIIIINDGSTDGTGALADKYALDYPSIVRVCHKENGGHGSGVNKGLSMARGLYFKVVDSDDWLDPDALKILMDRIRSFKKKPHLIVTNYVYDHLEEGKTKSMRFTNVFPEEKFCTWNSIGRFNPSQYLVMHAQICRTALLRKADVVLPEHTFYVDNIFANKPLPLVSAIYYMNIDLYHYYLGRPDQSVNEEVLKRRIDQQIKVTRLVARCVDLESVGRRYPKLSYYLIRNISIMLTISDIHLLLIGTDEAMEKRRILWQDLKAYDEKLYSKLKYRHLSGLTDLPGKPAAWLTVKVYRLANRIFRFQ